MTDLVVRKIAWEFDDPWMREYERGTDMTTFAGSTG